MDVTEIQIVVNVVAPNTQNRHHRFNPGSLEDKLRIKRQMIDSHVLVAIVCTNHGMRVVHNVAVCNCSELSDQDLDEIVREAYADTLRATEDHFLPRGYTLFASIYYRNITFEGMDVYRYFPQDSNKTCSPNLLKLTNYTLVVEELRQHNNGDCYYEASGYFYSSTPFVLPACYTILPLYVFPLMVGRTATREM